MARFLIVYDYVSGRSKVHSVTNVTADSAAAALKSFKNKIDPKKFKNIKVVHPDRQ